MDNSNKIVPPHLNAEIYRTDTTGTNTLSYLDYIRIHPDGNVLIGSSELTGRYWNGGASVFKDIKEAQKIKTEEKRSILLTSGTADGCFIGTSDRVLLCEDSGAVSVWSHGSEQQNVWHQWKEEISVAEHDGVVLAVDCLYPEEQYLTAGADSNIKVWDVNEMVCLKNFGAAHSMMVYAVAVRPTSHNAFASGSLDRLVKFWDDNMDTPVLELLNNDCCIRCLAWTDTNTLLIGDEAGVLRRIDVRRPGVGVKLTKFPAAIHKLVVHTEFGKVAVCCDNKIVTACDACEESEDIVKYQDTQSHNYFVRDAAWDVDEKDVLHTVGWNGEIISHNIAWS